MKHRSLKTNFMFFSHFYVVVFFSLPVYYLSEGFKTHLEYFLVQISAKI